MNDLHTYQNLVKRPEKPLSKDPRLKESCFPK